MNPQPEFNQQRMTLDYASLLEYSEYAGETVVPAEYEICDACRGTGVTTRHIERDGGGFTASEWAEECYEDPDFAEDYLSGVYDRPCPECQGVRVIPVPRWTEDLELLRVAVEDYYDQQRRWEHERRAEKRLGC